VDTGIDRSKRRLIMRRLYVIVAAAVAVIALVSVGLASASGTDSTTSTATKSQGRPLRGLLDGRGSGRRWRFASRLTRNADGTIAMIGRDTVLTLCDGTDRGVLLETTTTTSGAPVSEILLARVSATG
jgi:hypothetical protein